ncbi:hypothetical protein GP486_002316 [Trichoglossum hirsutum]|uniref:DNA repair protein Swi5/Sae3 n=1 Tax=Trichoglossum hirsutum TaxID=265104 RepID=A0A9P8RRU0_9PEZI|nr:hypothetical protein GP486_002316 [Trichoglossum hirsutum]
MEHSTTPTTPARSTTLDPEQPADTSSSTPAADDTPETKALNDKRRVGQLTPRVNADVFPLKANNICYANPEAAVTVKRHIKLLHDYNEIRDVGTGLMGMIADGRGVRVRDIYAELGVEVND